MILPTKYIRENRTLLCAGSVVLLEARRRHTVTSLWEKVRANPSVASYERFIMALDLLYCLGLIQLDDGIVKRIHR